MFLPLPLLAVWLSSHFQRRCHTAAPGCCSPVLPSRAWGRHSWVPCGAQAPRERRCCQRRAQMVLGAARDCNADSGVHCRAQAPGTAGAVKRGSAQAAVPGESLSLGAFPPSSRGGRQREGSSPVSGAVPATKQGETGQGSAASSLRGSCAPCSHTDSSLCL